MKANELKAAMDAQLAQVDARFAEVDSRFAEVDRRFDAVDQRFDAVDERFDAVDKRFDAVDKRLDAMDQRITAESEITRRYFDVVAEDLRSDMRMIAGAVAAISTTLERHTNAAAVERTTVTSVLDNHEVRLTALERRRT
ncbi:MAG: hypothetical protein AB7N65_14650 [Vicinamibacterales bacterium]